MREKTTKRRALWVTLTRAAIVCCLPASTAAQGQALVWRVAGADNTVYLAGSMHLLPKRAYPLAHAYTKAYAQAAMLVVEVDERKLQSSAARRRLRAAARYTHGGLADHIDRALYRRTQAVLAHRGLSLDRLGHFRPWFVAMAIEQQPYQAQGFRGKWGVDRFFYKRALADGKPILPLQTVAAHLAVFTRIPAALARAQLAVAVDHAGDPASGPKKIYRFWRTGDAGGFARAVAAQASAYPGLYNRLIYHRNALWLKTIAALLHSPENVMIVVGAAHLVGCRGLLAHLRAKGYRVARMDKGHR